MENNKKTKGRTTVYILTTRDGKRKNARLDVEQSCLPLLPKERHLGFYAMLALMTAGAIASWAFVTGTSIGVLVPVKFGICAALFGCTVAFAVHGYNCISFNRYGTDMSVLGRATWGHIGIYPALAVGFIATYGWGSLPMIMLGKGTVTIFDLIGVPNGWFFDTWQLWSVLALCFGLWITYVGTTAIDKFTQVAAPFIVALIIFIIIVLVKEYGGLNAIMNVAPAGVDATDRDVMVRNYMIAVEVALGVGFSWPYLFSAYTKPALSESGAYTPSVFGSGICWALCAVAPCMTAALSGMDDPVQALAQIGGSYALVWMIMLTVANASSVMINPYFLACATNAMFPKLKWKTCVGIQAIYLVAVLFPVFYDHFGAVISFVGLFEAPFGCIWALDLYLKGKHKSVNLRHCYNGKMEQQKKSAYWYFHGFNIAPWVGTLTGMFFGFAISNPYSGTIDIPWLYDLLGAMIPASIVGTLVYYIIYKVWQEPRKVGMPEGNQTIDDYAAEQAVK